MKRRAATSSRTHWHSLPKLALHLPASCATASVRTQKYAADSSYERDVVPSDDFATAWISSGHLWPPEASCTADRERLDAPPSEPQSVALRTLKPALRPV